MRGPQGRSAAKAELEHRLLAELLLPGGSPERRRPSQVLIEFRCDGHDRGRAPVLARICQTRRGPLFFQEVPARFSQDQIAAAKAAGEKVPRLVFPAADLLSMPGDPSEEHHQLHCRLHGARVTLSRPDLAALATSSALKRGLIPKPGPLIIRV